MSSKAIKCKDAVTLFREAEAAGESSSASLHPFKLYSEFKRHLENCSRCREEYHLHRLTSGVLRLGGAAEPMMPSNEWMSGLKARIAREDSGRDSSILEDPWQSAIWQTARQLIPIMAFVLLVILGATLLWSTNSGPRQGPDRASVRPSDRVFFNEVYEYPQPTTDDVLQTLVAVEEKQNGK